MLVTSRKSFLLLRNTIVTSRSSFPMPGNTFAVLWNRFQSSRFFLANLQTHFWQAGNAFVYMQKHFQLLGNDFVWLQNHFSVPRNAFVYMQKYIHAIGKPFRTHLASFLLFGRLIHPQESKIWIVIRQNIRYELKHGRVGCFVFRRLRTILKWTSGSFGTRNDMKKERNDGISKGYLVLWYEMIIFAPV